MAWVAVDKNSTEKICSWKPDRNKKLGIWTDKPCVIVPKGSTKKLIGKELTWEDEPVELK